jgi:hypothetical protein
MQREVRRAQAQSLHDRLIAVGDTEAWTLTQSLNDFGVRSPATIGRVNAGTPALKISAYAATWQGATAVP